ncbi:MAG: helicase-related protein, partial [Gammaproteobacteria bacterium]
AAYFADPYEGCQALICSEIGSEGRNFQFAHHLVLMDLPTEPDLLEQRIGRLDRIGQSEDIKIHVPVIQGSAMALLQDWYRDGLLAFERAATSGQAVRESLGDALESAIADASQRDALLERSRKLREEFDHALEAGRDRLLELHSHRPQVAKKLRHDIEAQDVDLALGDYMADIWAAFGVESEPGPGRTTVLHPGDHMMRDHFPQLPAEGTTLTLERSVALEREDYGFLSWEHPMTVGAMDMIMSETMGNTAFTVIQLKGIPPGTLLLELIYVAECNAPRELQVGRFLPPTPVRLLLDKNGKDHAPKVPHHLLKGECMSRERKTARSVIHSQAALIKAQFEAAEKLAQTRAGAIAETAMTAMHHELDEEISRMAYLSEVNPLVDEGDVELIRLRKERLGVHLREINVRLDAARLIIAA